MGRSLKSGLSTSCGCRSFYRKENPLIDLTGQKFGAISVIKKTGGYKNESVAWECKCDCGKELIYSTHELTYVGRKSCRCGIFYKKTLKDKLYSRFEKIDECWIWKKQKSQAGYGILWHENKQRLAHRLSYELHKGEIPEGLCVCHKCDTPLCINPDHLYIGTQQENMFDCAKKLRIKRKFDPEIIIKIKDELHRGERKVDISKKYNITSTYLKQIEEGNVWKHI